jgi:hypothetical protein
MSLAVRSTHPVLVLVALLAGSTEAATAVTPLAASVAAVAVEPPTFVREGQLSLIGWLSLVAAVAVEQALTETLLARWVVAAVARAVPLETAEVVSLATQVAVVLELRVLAVAVAQQEQEAMLVAPVRPVKAETGRVPAPQRRCLAVAVAVCSAVVRAAQHRP